MKYIGLCDKTKECCRECIIQSKTSYQTKQLRLALLELPNWEPCKFYKETKEDKKRKKELTKWFNDVKKWEEKSKKCPMVFKLKG